MTGLGGRIRRVLRSPWTLLTVGCYVLPFAIGRAGGFANAVFAVVALLLLTNALATVIGLRVALGTDRMRAELLLTTTLVWWASVIVALLVGVGLVLVVVPGLALAVALLFTPASIAFDGQSSVVALLESVVVVRERPAVAVGCTAGAAGSAAVGFVLGWVVSTLFPPGLSGIPEGAGLGVGVAVGLAFVTHGYVLVHYGGTYTGPLAPGTDGEDDRAAGDETGPGSGSETDSGSRGATGGEAGPDEGAERPPGEAVDADGEAGATADAGGSEDADGAGGYWERRAAGSRDEEE